MASKQKTVKILIAVLATLLALSLIALGATVIVNKLRSREVQVSVPDNLITPDDGSEEDNSDAPAGDGADSTADTDVADTDPSDTAPNTDTADNAKDGTTGGNAPKDAESATALRLYNKNPRENDPFHVVNMFPGDRITQYYRVEVSYRGTLTVHFGTEIRPGYEKLSEVLKAKVTLLTTGETLYDGLMAEMPESLDHKLGSETDTKDELFYEITAYLDTSVGNDYQDKGLVADFNWWVEEAENLTPPQQTGDSLIVLLSVAAAACVCCLILIIIIKRKKKEEKND